MELNYSFVYSEYTKIAFDKLFVYAGFDGQTAYNIKRIEYQIRKNSKEFKKKVSEIVKKYAHLSEQKTFIPDDNRFGVKFQEGGEAKAEAEFNELLTQKFDVPKCHKIPFDLVKSAKDLGLSAMDFTILEPLFEGLEPDL